MCEGRLIKIHNYLVGEVIGQGSFSMIRVCYRNKIDKVFAMKILSKKKLAGYGSGSSILFNERVLQPLLLHPNIIKVQEVVDSKCQLFVVSRYYEGGDLLAFLMHHSVHKQLALKMIDQLTSAVEYLHSNHICHRDIKLENLLLTDKKDIILSDFGLASFTVDGQVSESRGSLSYVAPEVLKNRTFDGYKADIWSLAVVIYAIFSRTMPYTCNSEDYKFEEPIDYSNIPLEIVDLLKQMFNKDPAKRPSIFEIRNHPLFTQKPVEVTNYEEPIENYDDFVVSRLSQIIHKPISYIRDQLLENQINLHKIIYHLLNQKISTVINTPSGEYASLTQCHSCPNVATKPTQQIRVYSVPSVNVLSAMRTYLDEQNGCVSAPSMSKRSIVINGQLRDKKVEFECLDLSECECSLAFSTTDRSNDLTDKLFDFLNNKFDSQRIPAALVAA